MRGMEKSLSCTCLSDACPEYNKTFRSDDADHYGCENYRSEKLGEFVKLIRVSLNASLTFHGKVEVIAHDERAKQRAACRRTVVRVECNSHLTTT